MEGFSRQNGFFGLSGLGPATSSGPTPAEQIAALFDGHDGIYLRGGDSSAYFLTDLGAVNVSADNDTVGLALDAHLMAGSAAGAFIDAQPELITNGTFDSNVDGWTNGGDGTQAWSTGALRYTRGNGTGRSYQVFADGTAEGRWFVLEGLTRIADGGGGNANINLRTADYTAMLPVVSVTSSSFQSFRGIGPMSAASSDYRAVLTVGAPAGTLAEIDDISVKEIPGNHLTQSTGSFRPKWQSATGARRYDAFDDRLASAKNAGASGNSIVMQLTAPASVASTQVLGGMQADASTRFYLAINASGQLCAGVGTDGTATIVGTTDIRGLTGTAALVEDGSTVKLYWNGVEEYSAAQNGSPTTTIPFYEGALNNNGTPQAFCGADILDTIFITTALTPAEIAARTNNWS